jgi:hypothetical protein
VYSLAVIAMAVELNERVTRQLELHRAAKASNSAQCGGCWGHTELYVEDRA